jgi:hypothetical protein
MFFICVHGKNKSFNSERRFKSQTASKAVFIRQSYSHIASVFVIKVTVPGLRAGLHVIFLSSVLHDKVLLTDKTDSKHAAPLFMLSLSLLLGLSINTMDEALFV